MHSQKVGLKVGKKHIKSRKITIAKEEIIKDESGDMGGCYDEEYSHSSDQAEPTSQSEESHSFINKYSYSPRPRPGGWVFASSKEELPTFEVSAVKLTDKFSTPPPEQLKLPQLTHLLSKKHPRYDHIAFKRCSNVLKNKEKDLKLGKYSEEKKQRGSRHFFFTQLRRILKQIGFQGLIEWEKQFVEAMQIMIQEEETKQLEHGENALSKLYILQFNRAIIAYRQFVKEEFYEAFKTFYGYNQKGFKQKNKMESAYANFLKALKEDGQPTESESEHEIQEVENKAEMTSDLIIIGMMELERLDSEPAEIENDRQDLVNPENLIIESSPEMETELIEVESSHLTYSVELLDSFDLTE